MAPRPSNIFVATALCVLFAGFAISGVEPNKDLLLSKYETQERAFKRVEIGDMIVYFHQRMLGEAIVEGDYIAYQFDKATGELLNKRIHWRDDLSALVLPEVTREEAESMVEGDVQFSRLFLISAESDVVPLKPTPKNPCWIVRSIHHGTPRVTVVDAVLGAVLGNGIPPPSHGFAFSGPIEYAPCYKEWIGWYQNAAEWFNAMGFPTEAVKWPTKEQVQGHVQSCSTSIFYELAHGCSTSFVSGCFQDTSPEYTTAGDIREWIADFPKIPFTFIGSCDGMCNVDSGTFSYEFRKGSMDNTVTVGYCRMDQPECILCWKFSIEWQDALFSYMSQGYTVKKAFERALADYPMCGECMRFAGDENVALPFQRNRDPMLFDEQVTPSVGMIDTVFTYHVRFYDGDGDTPSVALIYIDGIPHEMYADVPDGSSFSYRTTLPAGAHTFHFYFKDGCGACRLPEAGVFVGPSVTRTFIRGDVDANGTIALFDALQIVFWLGGKAQGPSCIKTADANDDGFIDIFDALRIIAVLVDETETLPEPCCVIPTDCGVDPTPDKLTCDHYSPCGAPPWVCGEKPEPVGQVEKSRFVVGVQQSSTGHGSVVIPVNLINDRPLAGFSFTLRYDQEHLRARQVDNAGLVTEGFDLFIGAVKKAGVVRVVALPDLDVSDDLERLPPGEHRVARLLFAYEGSSGRDVVLDLTDGVMALDHEQSLRHELVDGKIDGKAELPTGFALLQNYPNPFNTSTEIRFDLSKDCRVKLEIFALTGQRVVVLVEGAQKAGHNMVVWNARTFPSGIYLCRLQAGKFMQTRRMVLLK